MLCLFSGVATIIGVTVLISGMNDQDNFHFTMGALFIFLISGIIVLCLSPSIYKEYNDIILRSDDNQIIVYYDEDYESYYIDDGFIKITVNDNEVYYYSFNNYDVEIKNYKDGEYVRGYYD